MNWFQAPSTPELIAKIKTWNENLALLRGDNLYDMTRLYFSALGYHSLQYELSADVPHGATTKEEDRRIVKIFGQQILPNANLRFIKTLMGRLIVTETDIVGVLVNPVAGSTTITYDVLGLPALCDYIREQFNTLIASNKTNYLHRLRMGQNNSLTTVVETIAPVDKVSDIQRFYPYLSKTPAQVWDEFSTSNSNILLLIGPPGTGKSNFVLQMMDHRGWDDKVYLADREDVLLHPGLSDMIRDCPGGSVFITEDSDKLVMKRTEGNGNMSALLNTSAGIVARDVKIIISTNLNSIKNVDEALVRPGRCFDILTFGMLTAEQAAAVRDMMELPFVNLINPTYTLAEAINLRENITNRQPQAFGFNQ